MEIIGCKNELHKMAVTLSGWFSGDPVWKFLKLVSFKTPLSHINFQLIPRHISEITLMIEWQAENRAIKLLCKGLFCFWDMEL